MIQNKNIPIYHQSNLFFLIVLPILFFYAVFCHVFIFWKIKKIRVIVIRKKDHKKTLNGLNQIELTLYKVEHKPNFQLIGEHYPSKQGIPSAKPRTFASFIIHENSDPIFLRSEGTLWEFVSSRVTCFGQVTEFITKKKIELKKEKEG